MLGKPAPQHLPGAWTDLTRPYFPGFGVHIVECQLLPMHVEAAYDRHWTFLELLKNFSDAISVRPSRGGPQHISSFTPKRPFRRQVASAGTGWPCSPGPAAAAAGRRGRR